MPRPGLADQDVPSLFVLPTLALRFGRFGVHDASDE
jgi:hypothetical protein